MEAQTGIKFTPYAKSGITGIPSIAEIKSTEGAGTGPIGKEQVRKARETLEQYKKGKTNLEERIVDNEQWYKMRHWEQIRTKSSNQNDPQPASAWLFNSIANKHADAMDNYPEPNVLPREESDKPIAETLSEILPVILECNDFEQTYSDAWWYKLKAGTGVYGVFWNPRKDNGLGDIDIKKMDLLNIFWEPGISDLQKSRNLFTVELVSNELLEAQYPQLTGKVGDSSLELAKYIYDDTVDTSEKSAVVDWYYKVSRPEGGEILHYCKFVNDEVIYSSENDPTYAERGYYDHGMYPIILDVMFMEEGTPAGFGYIDIMKDCQMYIDKLGQGIIKNAVALSRPRYLVKDNSGINEQEYADLSKDFVHVNSNSVDDDHIRQIQIQPLSGVYVEIMNQKIDELKETSGNRDFSQGSTTSGVTAASAIAALQEAGSKLSRDMIKSAYRAFAGVNKLVIELIRQFYDTPRCFRIVGERGATKLVQFDNTGMTQTGGGNEFGLELGARKPVFDLKVTSQKASPFSKVAQNELAKELYQLGFFNPQLSDQALATIQMMDFEGKDMVEQRISQNGTMFQQIQQMQAQMQQMAAVIAQSTGDPRLLEALTGQQQGATMPQVSGSHGESVETDQLGAEKSKATTAGKARERVAEAATPRV